VDSPIFESLTKHAEHQVLRRRPGFEFTPVLLGKISPLIVRPPTGGWAVFTFMFPLLTRKGDPTDEDESHLTTAPDTITRLAIDEGRAINSAELTYEWRDGGWREVLHPAWWLPIRS
jgi:hypothetical protein